MVLAGGCGSLFNGPGGGALAQGLLHALVVAPALVGASVASQAIQQAQQREVEEAPRTMTASAASARPCNYWLRCNAKECYFETSDGLIVTCEGWDCRDHAPPQLQAWCPK